MRAFSLLLLFTLDYFSLLNLGKDYIRYIPVYISCFRFTWYGTVCLSSVGVCLEEIINWLTG